MQIGNNHDVTTAIGPLILLNPGVVRQGTDVNVTGTGFAPHSVVTLSITRQGSGAALASTVVKADKSGGFYGAAIAVPNSLSAGSFNVVAQERNSSTSAQAIGSVAGGAPQVKLGPQVGQPGEVVTVSLNGFAPEETINVYWNTMSGKPLTTLQANGGGGVGQGQLHVPYGAVGENTFLFVGAKSLSLVAANFLMLNLYPTVRLSSYALKADNLLSFTGKGFGPGEPVLVFLNSTESQPLAVVSADGNGSFKNAPGFVIPYVLKGKQTLIFMGEQSRAPDSVNFTILPYSPVVEPSTYGGLPGTAISFYVTGFAPNEVVHVYAGHTKSTLGNMVGCFQTNGQGKAADVGSYLIPGNAQGALGFALVGAKSGGVGTASVNVSAPPAPIQTPAQAPFTCPLDQPAQPSQPSTPAAGAQGRVAPPSHQLAAQSGMSPLTRARPEADLAGAVVSPKVMSIVVGVGLVWGVAVMILTCLLIWRSYLLAMVVPPDAASKAPRKRSTLASSPRQVANRSPSAVGEVRVARLAHAMCASARMLLSSVRGRRITGGQRHRASSVGPGVGIDRERRRVHGRLHFALTPSAGGRTTIHASRPYRAAHIASRQVSCRRAGWHRLTSRAWLQNGDSGGM